MEPRYDGVDADHLAWMLTALDQAIDLTLDELEYRLYRDYMARAQLRWGAGFHPDDVHHDLLWAARCLRFKDDLHLIKVPPQRFRSRRIDPLEMGAASGDQLLANQIAERYAIPLPLVVAGLADNDLMREVRTVTRCLDGPPRDALDVAGLAAVAWSGALASGIRGFDDEVELAIEMVAAVADDPVCDDAGPLGRYKRLFAGLGAILAGDGPMLARAISSLLAGHETGLREGMTEQEWLKPPVAPRYFDVSAVALSALFALRGEQLDVSLLTGDAVAFADLLRVEEVRTGIDPEEAARYAGMLGAEGVEGLDATADSPSPQPDTQSERGSGPDGPARGG